MSTEIYEGRRPRYEGHATLEMHEPVPVTVSSKP